MTTGFSEQHRHGGGIPFFQCLLQVYGCSVQPILLQLSSLEDPASPFYPPPFIYTSFAGFCKSGFPSTMLHCISPQMELFHLLPGTLKTWSRIGNTSSPSSCG